MECVLLVILCWFYFGHVKSRGIYYWNQLYLLFFNKKDSYEKPNLRLESHFLPCIMLVLENSLTLALGPAWANENHWLSQRAPSPAPHMPFPSSCLPAGTMVPILPIKSFGLWLWWLGAFSIKSPGMNSPINLCKKKVLLYPEQCYCCLQGWFRSLAVLPPALMKPLFKIPQLLPRSFERWPKALDLVKC